MAGKAGAEKVIPAMYVITMWACAPASPPEKGRGVLAAMLYPLVSC